MTGRQKWTIMAFVPYLIALFISTHIPIPQIVYKAQVSDKWLHFFVYLNLTFLMWFSIRPDNRPLWRKPLAWLILAVALALAGVDEITQPYFGRSKDLYDFIADSEGVLTGFVMFTFMSFWPSLLGAVAITIFSITNLAQADLSKLVPVVDALFNFFSYASFALVWIQFMKPCLFYKSASIRFLPALIVPAGFMLAVKTGSLLMHRHFGRSDLLFGALGIIAVVAVSHLTGFLYSDRHQ